MRNSAVIAGLQVSTAFRGEPNYRIAGTDVGHDGQKNPRYLAPEENHTQLCPPVPLNWTGLGLPPVYRGPEPTTGR
jgi:hypothetical protein